MNEEDFTVPKELVELTQELQRLKQQQEHVARGVFEKKDNLYREKMKEIMIARVSNDKNDSVLRGFRCVFGSNFETYQFFAYSEERKDHIMVYPNQEEVLLNGFRLYRGDPKHEELMKRAKLYYDHHILQVSDDVWKKIEKAVLVGSESSSSSTASKRKSTTPPEDPRNRKKIN